MHKQIPSIGNQRARQECATGNRIDERETNPYLPENCKDRLVGIGMMQGVLRWR
jgi:hypothetical protein